MKLTTALRNTIVSDIITAAGTNPKLKYYTGTESLTPACHADCHGGTRHRSQRRD